MIFYAYARLGMYMFGGKLDLLQGTLYPPSFTTFIHALMMTMILGDKPPSTFDTFGQSIITLFQLLIGSAWSDLMCKFNPSITSSY
jgi:hypothetical protein